MRTGLRARPLVPLAVAIATVLTLFAAPVDAAAIPTLRLFVANSELTLERNSRDVVSFDPGVWVAPVSGDFELWISRPDYDTPIGLTQVDSATRQVLRTLPVDKLAGLSGLSEFAHYEIRSGGGALVAEQTIDYCPNSYLRQRVSDGGSLNPRYPYFCGGGPFVKGQVWGIDEGWASGLVSDYYGLGFRAPRNRYTATFWIDPEWVDLLDIAPSEASAEIAIRVVDRGELDRREATSSVPAARPFAPTPDVTNPDPSTLPDLVALPGWGMNTYSRKGRDYLAFGSTEWNQGPGTFVIEGFRGQNEDSMDGFQYFIDESGVPIGRSLIGELEYHRGGGHDHWHFEEFTQYSLLDAEKAEVVVSGKQSWCLINTDAIDLTVPNANWLGYGQDLSTACGGPGALWIREVLDVGWGDTYFQSVRGQAFNITGVPNGTYHVRVHVNPTGNILETSTDNNIEDRLIKLKGRPGHRRVVVPPWHGIDTEGCDYFC
jgi:Lysyl oxidase